MRRKLSGFGSPTGRDARTILRFFKAGMEFPLSMTLSTSIWEGTDRRASQK
jgi:hypothetical protein